VAFYYGNVRAFDELYAGSNLVKAREIFTAAIKHGLRIGPTIRQRTRVLDERPRKCAVALGLRMEKKLSDQYASVCDAELAALEARMITIPATLALGGGCDKLTRLRPDCVGLCGRGKRRC
jgi:hypothetical protein